MLAATRELLAEEGYSALTFSMVARRAGVTRQLLHRWWPLKASLVAEAVFGPGGESWPTEYTGDLATDVRSIVSAVVDFACRPEVRAGVLGLMADADPSTPLPGLIEGSLDPLDRSIETFLATTEVEPGIDPRLMLDTIRGAVVLHVIADQLPPDVVVDHLATLITRALRP